MPPRTKNVCVKRKKMHDGDPGNSSKSFHSGYFTNPKHSELYTNDYSLRTLDTTYALDLSWFRSKTGFEFIDWLDNHKLLNFLTTKGPVVPELVRAFYTTLAYDAKTETLTAELKGTMIHLTLAQFSSITHLPYEGEKLIQMCSPDSWTTFNLENACISIRHPMADIEKRPILANTLTTQIRLLHYTIARIILPKHSNIAQVSYDEVTLLWGIKNRKRINWAHLVISHMLKCKTTQAKSLPYCVLITNILRHFKISCLGEKILKGNEAYHMFGASTINQMHLIQDGDYWYHATIGFASTQEYDPNDVEPMTPGPDPNRTTSVPDPTAPASSSTPLEQMLAALNIFQTEQREMYEDTRREILLSREIHSREFASLHTRLTALETRLGPVHTEPSAPQDSDPATAHLAGDHL